MHIFLTGEIQVGKSTIINSFFEKHPELVVGGFKTLTKYFDNDPEILGTVHIMPADGEPVFTDENCIGVRYGDGKYKAYPETFETAGIKLLYSKREDDIILMDEVGKMESRAENFSNAILHNLDKGIPVFGVIRPYLSTPLLDAIRSDSRVEIIEITPENRDTMRDIVHQKILECIEECRQYRHYRKVTNSCGAAVFRYTDDLEVLLVKSFSERWSFPKGHIEPGETEVETAKREIFEETHIEAEIDTGFRMTTPSKFHGDMHDVIIFAGEYVSGNVEHRKSEVGGAAWVKASEAAELFAFDEDRDIYLKVLEYYKNKKEDK